MMIAGVAAVVCAAPAGAQPDWYDRWRPDSLELAPDAVPIRVEEVVAECDPPGNQVVRDSADAAEIRPFRGCDPFPFAGLGRELYVRVVMMGDCHALHTVHAFRSDARREYRVVTVNRYGGCRAGGSEQQWIRLAPLPDGWTIGFTERRIDRPWGADSLGVATDAVPTPLAREWIDCHPAGVWVVRGGADVRALRRVPGCAPSAFPALGRATYVHVPESAVCSGPYDVHGYRSDARREYRLVRLHRSRACYAEGGGPRWYRLPALPPGWTVALSEGGG
jgi:hypothetical protein